MSVVYMQIWLLGKDFLRDHWAPFPASTVGDYPSAWPVPLLGHPSKGGTAGPGFTTVGHPSIRASELRKFSLFTAQLRLWHRYLIGTNSWRTLSGDDITVFPSDAGQGQALWAGLLTRAGHGDTHLRREAVAATEQGE